MKIFWSWQSDIESRISRKFIKECIQLAIEEAVGEKIIDERIEIDHDTKGVLGSPSITDTIFSKIKSCNLFIGDVTPVAKNIFNKKKL